MNQNSTPAPLAGPAAPAAPPPARPLDRKAVTAALAAVRVDSQRQPETYLRDTVVPHGGE